jgi:deoxyribodipyrimidine photo-lyase
VHQTLRDNGIPLHLLMGDPVQNIPAFARAQDAMLLVTDFSPLRIGLGWVKAVAAALDSQGTGSSNRSSSSSGNGGRIPLVQVDAHNVVPCWVASPKLEYGARTIRGKINARLPEFLTPIPPLAANPPGHLDCDPADWAAALASLQIDRSVPEITFTAPGTAAGYQTVEHFISKDHSVAMCCMWPHLSDCVLLQRTS